VIPIGTRLTPRDADDPILEVGGVEGSRYSLKNAEVFSCTIALTCDELAAKYDTSGYEVYIEPFDEISAWWKMATAKPKRANRAKPVPEYSPEEIFAAEAAKAAK
jgi:hypothetical protein